MNYNQDNSYRKQGTSLKQGNRRKLWIGICSLVASVVLISLVICACTDTNINKSPSASQPSRSGSSTNSVSGNSSTPSNVPTNIPSTPPSTPSPTQPSIPPSQPSLSLQTPSANTANTGTLIKKEAYQMVLTIDDMGQGWSRGSAGSRSIQNTYSVGHVYYSQGGYSPPVVQNTVAVYRSLEAASNAYEKEKPTSAPFSSPRIGDECFLSDSVPLNKELVFRKSNVVVWVWLQQDRSGDIEHYARIVEQKVTP